MSKTVKLILKTAEIGIKYLTSQKKKTNKIWERNDEFFGYEQIQSIFLIFFTRLLLSQIISFILSYHNNLLKHTNPLLKREKCSITWGWMKKESKKE